MNSVTCFASCQNFSKLMCPLGNLKIEINKPCITIRWLIRLTCLSILHLRSKGLWREVRRTEWRFFPVRLSHQLIATLLLSKLNGSYWSYLTNPFDVRGLKIWLIGFSPTRKFIEIIIKVIKKSENLFSYSFLETRNWRHVEPGDDCHQTVEIPYVERLACCFNPKLDNSHTLLLLRMLWRWKRLVYCSWKQL